MQEGLHTKIRSVSIHYGWCISGFSFFDNNKKLLWKIGLTGSSLKVETVELEKNEGIVGVVAKLKRGWQSMYTDF